MLEMREYLERIESLHRNSTGRTAAGYTHRKTINQYERNSMEFASANLHYFLPDIPIESHPGIIDTIFFNRECSDLDEDNFFLLDSIHVSDPNSVLVTAKERPVIFCTFHYGSYRLINPLLVSRGFNYILPVEGAIYAEQKMRFQEGCVKCQEYFNSTSQFMVVNAEQPTAALTMARKTRKGWSLLAYIDGNTGVQGGGRHDAKMLRISLLGKWIYARKGIAFLSHFLKLPIVPVICEITGPTERSLRFHDKIDPSDHEGNREDYCMMATEKLYSILGDYLKRSPSQWLGWLEMQKYLDLDNLTDSKISDTQREDTVSLVGTDVNCKYTFNHKRFGFIVNAGQRVLLDKTTYKLLSVPDDIADILETYRQPMDVLPSNSTDERREMIEQLVSLEMLAVVGN
jgi:lauroyl/myristoyl acyltransferase